MLLSTNGSRLHILVSPSSWAEIAEVSAIGGLGAELPAQMIEALNYDEPQFIKSPLTQRAPMTLVMANIPSDTGQQALWTGLASDAPVSFRLVFSDGTTTREWAALITRIHEAIDQANNVMLLEVDTQPITPFSKGVV